MFTTLFNLIERGGVVMWPLIAMSVVGVTLIIERLWFWARTNRPGRGDNTAYLTDLLRKGNADAARKIASQDPTFYGALVIQLLDGLQDAQSDQMREAVGVDAIETLRPSLERFMPTLSTIITAAPLLGILGTVTGIIASFGILSQGQSATDPQAVSAGIAEALLSTAAGLVIAIVVLFPYNAYRAQLDRTLGRAESIIAAATGVRENVSDR